MPLLAAVQQLSDEEVCPESQVNDRARGRGPRAVEHLSDEENEVNDRARGDGSSSSRNDRSSKADGGLRTLRKRRQAVLAAAAAKIRVAVGRIVQMGCKNCKAGSCMQQFANNDSKAELVKLRKQLFELDKRDADNMVRDSVLSQSVSQPVSQSASQLRSLSGNKRP